MRAENSPEHVRVLAYPYRDSDNPYTRLLYDAMTVQGARVTEFRLRNAWATPVDVVHVHWPEFVLATRWWPLALMRCVAFLATLTLHRLRGAAVVWTVHNLQPHASRHTRLERRFRQRLTPLLTGVCHLSRASLELAEAGLSGDVASAVVPHGDYRSAYPPLPPRDEARRKLGYGADEAVVLGFGYLKPYKHFDLLIERFSVLPVEDARLLVVGAPADEATVRHLRALAEREPRVTFKPERLDEQTVADVFAATDVVMLPYVEILNSGVALLAASFDRRVVAPARGALVELHERLGAGWVRLFEPPLTTDDLASALAWAATPAPPGPATADLPTWSEIARATLELYDRARPIGQRQDGAGRTRRA